MNLVDPQNETALRARLAESRERLAQLSEELRAIDEELGSLEVERVQFSLLQEICSGLEKLDEQEGASLFWEGLAAPDGAHAHLGRVRRRLDGWNQQLRQIEDARARVLDRIASEEEDGELIVDDLYELRRAEEARKNEWVVEREASPLPRRPTIMPWTHGSEDDQRFRRTLAAALLASLLLAILFPWIPLPVPDRWEVVEVPERLTRLIKQERLLPPPPPQKQEVEPEQPKEEETPLLAEEGTPQPSAAEPAPKPGATSKGILALRDRFSSLPNSSATARLGSQARISSAADAASGRPTRSLVTTQGPGTSGGIDLASLSRNVGGGGNGIEGVEVARATSAIGAIGGGTDRPLAGKPGSSRTDEEIQIVFDRHKAALYRLYNRELRRDPTLQGQMVLRLSIEPDGSVSLCEVKSSDMKAPELAKQVAARVRTFDFGAKEGIPAITILYPIDFLPAT